MPDKEHPGSRHTLFHHLCQKKLSEILPLPWNVGVRLRPMQMFTMWRTLCTLNAKTLLRLVCFMFYDKTCTPLTIRVRLFIFWFAECRNFVHSSGLWGMLFIFFLFSDGFFLFSVFWSICLFLLVGLSLSPQTSLRNGRSHTGKWSCIKGCLMPIVYVLYAKYLRIHRLYGCLTCKIYDNTSAIIYLPILMYQTPPPVIRMGHLLHPLSLVISTH